MKGKILDLKINYEVWYEKVRFLLLKIGRFFFFGRGQGLFFMFLVRLFEGRGRTFSCP